MKRVIVSVCVVLFYLTANASAVLSDTTDDLTGTISAHGQNLPSEGTAKVFDNNSATKWLDFSPTSSWIQYQYAAGKISVVTEYTLTSANDAQERDPTNWNLLGSNNGGSSWVTLDTRTGELFTARFQKRSFSFTNSTGYNIYRLEITQLRGPAPNSVQLAEIEFIGTPPAPPAKAISPNPANSAISVPITATLSWTAGWGAASHDVYFGADFNDVNSAERLLGDLKGNGIVDLNDVSLLTQYWLTDPAGTEPYAAINTDNVVDFFDYALLSQGWMESANPVFKGNQDANSFNPGTLAISTTYYWRIDEVNGPNTVTGDVWSFATQSGKASNPSPANSASNVAINATLSWTAGSGALSHNVYFGTANPPPSIGSQTAATYIPGTLANSTTYCWRIDEVGGSGTVTGDVWSFTTVASGPQFEYTFVQASDPQMGWTQCGNMDYLWGTTIGKINNINPAFVIVTGDLINTSSSNTQAATYKSYAAGINPWIPIYTAPGNHDISEPSNSTKYAWWLANLAYPTGLANPWYSFTYGNDIFICLDDVTLRSPWGGKDTEEMNWLTQTLIDANAAGYAHKFVFMHVALFITSATEAYNSADNLPLTIRGQLLSLFHQYGVKVVMAGHRHTNNDAVDGDLEMFTTTSCTCGLGSPRTPPGIRIFKVYSDHVEQEVRTLDSLP